MNREMHKLFTNGVKMTRLESTKMHKNMSTSKHRDEPKISKTRENILKWENVKYVVIILEQ